MAEYLVIIERADGNFSAYSPDLPGCVATGTSREDAEANRREAVRLHLLGLRAEGFSIPEPSASASRISLSHIMPRLDSTTSRWLCSVMPVARAEVAELADAQASGACGPKARGSSNLPFRTTQMLFLQLSQ